MKLSRAYAQNFGSYKEIEFDYSDLGLALIAGPTGVGKSSLLDLPCWVLFGTTSKDLNADDVRSWFSDEPTKGMIRIERPQGALTVTRIRGKRPSQNDLYYEVDATDCEQVRGKDALDTQKMIEAELGVTADLYLAASYLHQFTGDKFFTAKAKDRRDSMERIANMDLAVSLGANASAARKVAKEELETVKQTAAKARGKIEALESSLRDHELAETQWRAKHAQDIERLEALSASFDEDKEMKVFSLVEKLEELDKQIKPSNVFTKRATSVREQLKSLEPVEKQLKDLNNQLSTVKAELKSAEKSHSKYSELNDICPTCLGPSDNPNRAAHLEEIAATMQSLITSNKNLSDEVNRLTEAVAAKPKLQENLTRIAIEESDNNRLIDKFQTLQAQAIALRDQKNPHDAELERARGKENPHTQQAEKTRQNIVNAASEHGKLEKACTDLAEKISALTWLYDKSYELRGLFLTQAVKQINDRTNQILEKHFDAQIRVDFALVDSDKLEVTISNSGYECKYAQLSGGERCMLLLAFNFAYMRAAENKAGIKFGTLMLDEALNGFDADLKTRAFGLLQEIEQDYSSVLLIDHHEEFKQLFSNRFSVSKDGAYSAISADSI